MNDALQNLFAQLKNAGPSARWAMGAAVAVAVAIAGMLAFQARNPHFVVLAADLDAPSFNTAVTALASADIRYETSMGAPPYIIRVEESKKHEALNAIYQSGDFLGEARGISSGLSGSSSVFLGQSERHQRTQKRLWEETEMQLERVNYVAKANVTVSGTQTSPLARLRPDERRVSVVLTLRGLSSPTASQTRALVGIVRGATGVSDERIAIIDQHSNVLFDGADSGGADSLLAIEDKFSRDRTNQAQGLLDRTFPPGLTVVGVTANWKVVHQESVSETLTPAKKPRTERTRQTKEPEWARNVGGPAGVAANTQESATAGAAARSMELATTSEKEATYSFGKTTTHQVSQPHQLERLSISLVVDASMADRMEDAEALVKALVGFDAERGDVIETRSTALPGVERDSEGIPILPEPIEPPEASSPMLKMAFEHGLELIAGLAFLMVLLKSLKSARATGVVGTDASAAAAGGAVGAQSGASGGPSSRDYASMDDSVDMDALARAHIEELLEAEPEKVSQLLSRWALSEDAFAEAGAR